MISSISFEDVYLNTEWKESQPADDDHKCDPLSSIDEYSLSLTGRQYDWRQSSPSLLQKTPAKAGTSQQPLVKDPFDSPDLKEPLVSPATVPETPVARCTGKTGTAGDSVIRDSPIPSTGSSSRTPSPLYIAATQHLVRMSLEDEHIPRALRQCPISPLSNCLFSASDTADIPETQHQQHLSPAESALDDELHYRDFFIDHKIGLPHHRHSLENQSNHSSPSLAKSPFVPETQPFFHQDSSSPVEAHGKSAKCRKISFAPDTIYSDDTLPSNGGDDGATSPGKSPTPVNRPIHGDPNGQSSPEDAPRLSKNSSFLKRLTASTEMADPPISGDVFTRAISRKSRLFLMNNSPAKTGPSPGENTAKSAHPALKDPPRGSSQLAHVHQPNQHDNSDSADSSRYGIGNKCSTAGGPFSGEIKACVDGLCWAINRLEPWIYSPFVVKKHSSTSTSVMPVSSSSQIQVENANENDSSMVAVKIFTSSFQSKSRSVFHDNICEHFRLVPEMSMLARKYSLLPDESTEKTKQRPSSSWARCTLKKVSIDEKRSPMTVASLSFVVKLVDGCDGGQLATVQSIKDIALSRQQFLMAKEDPQPKITSYLSSKKLEDTSNKEEHPLDSEKAAHAKHAQGLFATNQEDRCSSVASCAGFVSDDGPIFCWTGPHVPKSTEALGDQLLDTIDQLYDLLTDEQAANRTLVILSTRTCRTAKYLMAIAASKHRPKISFLSTTKNGKSSGALPKDICTNVSAPNCPLFNVQFEVFAWALVGDQSSTFVSDWAKILVCARAPIILICGQEDSHFHSVGQAKSSPSPHGWVVLTQSSTRNSLQTVRAALSSQQNHPILLQHPQLHDPAVVHQMTTRQLSDILLSSLKTKEPHKQ